MAVLTEPKWPGEFLYSEGNGRISRDLGTLISGQNLVAGTVLGLIAVGAAGAPAATGGNTGNGTITAVALGAKAKPGTYTIRMTGATTYIVLDPDGIELAPGTAAGAYTDPEIGFTFTAGGTPMVAGDSFTIAVAAGSGKWTGVAPAALDGSQVASGILFAGVDASGGDKPCVVIRRMAEVNQAELNWGTLNAGQITAAIAQLAAAGVLVLVRPAV